MAQVAIDIYAQIAEIAVPMAIAFEICNLIVNTVIRSAFGGRLWFGR